MMHENKHLPVLGHNALTATPSDLNSSAIPSTHIDIPYFAIVYAKKQDFPLT